VYLLICNIAYLHTKDNRTKPICPLNWEQRKLGENSEILTGGTPKTQNKKFWEPKEIPWMSSGEINKKRLFYTDNMISKLGFKNSSARWVREHSVLIALAGQGKTRGTVAINEISLTTNQSIAAIEPNQTIDSEFLYQNLGNRYEELRLSSSGDGTRGGLNKKIISEINVVTPSINEQIKIGQFFKGIDDTITLHQRKLDSLHKLKTAYLQQLFPQNGELVPRLRFAKYNENWEQRKLGETKTFYTDGNYGESYPTENDMSDSEKGVPFLRGSNLKNGKLDISSSNYITLEKHKELTTGHLIYDDVVIAVRGSLGALGYVDKVNVDWNINSQLAIIRTDKNELSGAFIIQFLSSNRGQKELLSRQTGTALKQLPIKQLKDISVPVPNIEEQNKISDFLKKFDDTITLHQNKLEQLRSIKNAFLQKIFL